MAITLTEKLVKPSLPADPAQVCKNSFAQPLPLVFTQEIQRIQAKDKIFVGRNMGWAIMKIANAALSVHGKVKGLLRVQHPLAVTGGIPGEIIGTSGNW